MSYPAKAIANYFIHIAAQENDKSLDLMKLLKLIYMSHGWGLALYEKPLINEKICAWQYGPVIAEIYNEFKHCGIDKIDEPARDYDVGANGEIIINKYEPNFDKETSALLKRIWNVCKNLTGIQLSNWSHDPDGPWYKIWYEKKGYLTRSCPIPNELIADYFTKLRIANEQSQERQS